MPLRLVPGRDRKLYRLVKRGELRDLRRGEVLYSAGDPGGEVYLVTSGLLRLTVDRLDGPERAVDLVGPWEMAGEEGLAPGAARRTGARAAGGTRVTVLGGEEASQALRTASRTFGVFLQSQQEALALARISGSSGGAASKVAAVLLHLSARFGRKEGNALRIPIRITHQVLADLSGSHRSTVTTLLNEWIYDGILGSQGGELWALRPRALADHARGTRAPGGHEPARSVDRKSP